MPTNETPPRLTEKQLKSLASSQSFERGDRYYQNGAILNPTRQGQDLWADCQGSELYTTRATLGDNDVTAASCTCEYDWGGLCKHQVALLLTYIRQPQAFSVIPPIAELLASRSKEDLMTLIGQMLRKHPDLMTLVEFSSPRPLGQRLDLSSYRRQAQRAFRCDDPHNIIEDLELLCEQADRLAQQGDWLNAGSIYQLLLAEATQNYTYEVMDVDYNGDVGLVIQDIVDCFDDCLAQAQTLDAATRELWFMTLLEAGLHDVELGGIDFAAGAWDALLRHVTEAEWQPIATRIQAELPEQRSWGQSQLTSLLSSYYKQAGLHDIASAVIHELGSPEQRVFLLVDEGEIDAAIALATAHFARMPGLVTQVADALVAAGASTQAVQFMTEQYQAQTHWSYSKWLVTHYETQSDPETALVWQHHVYKISPSLENYQKLRELAHQSGSWNSIRSKTLSTLEQQKQFRPLLEIALEEKDIDRALALLPQLPQGEQVGYALNVATAAEKTHPIEAIRLYLLVVDRHIAQRNRGAYQTAVSYLARLKALYEAIGKRSDWNLYIQKIRSQYSNLRALQDELNKAKV